MHGQHCVWNKDVGFWRGEHQWSIACLKKNIHTLHSMHVNMIKLRNVQFYTLMLLAAVPRLYQVENSLDNHIKLRKRQDVTKQAEVQIGRDPK